MFKTCQWLNYKTTVRLYYSNQIFCVKFERLKWGNVMRHSDGEYRSVWPKRKNQRSRLRESGVLITNYNYCFNRQREIA